MSSLTRTQIVKGISFLVAQLALVGVVAGQSLLTGDVAGLVADPTGAAVPGATVTLKSVDTGAVQTQASNSSGE
jgi:hypothetical protein